MAGQNGGSSAHSSACDEKTKTEQLLYLPIQQTQCLTLQLDVWQAQCNHQRDINHNPSSRSGAWRQLRVPHCEADGTKFTTQADLKYKQGNCWVCPSGHSSFNNLLSLYQTCGKGERRGKKQESSGALQNCLLLPPYAALLRACQSQTEHGHYRRIFTKVPAGCKARSSLNISSLLCAIQAACISISLFQTAAQSHRF